MSDSAAYYLREINRISQFPGIDSQRLLQEASGADETTLRGIYLDLMERFYVESLEVERD